MRWRADMMFGAAERAVARGMFREAIGSGGSPGRLVQARHVRAYSPPEAARNAAPVDRRVAAVPDHLSNVSDGTSSELLVNEVNPSRARPILAAASAGCYLSVGADRGLVGYALTPRATGLIVTDRDWHVVRFHLINRALLRCATDQAHYVRLRLHATGDEWMEAAARCALPEAEQNELSDKAWSWWERYVRQSTELGTIIFHARDRAGHIHADTVGNYLFDTVAFHCVHAAACAGLIRIWELDWKAEDAALRLATCLNGAGVTIGVFDISNMWQPKHAGTWSILRTIARLAPVASDESLVLGTVPYQRMTWFPGYCCAYQGWTFRHLLGRGETPLRESYSWGPDLSEYLFASEIAR